MNRWFKKPEMVQIRLFTWFGRETIARVLTRGISHLLADTETLDRWRQEVKVVMPHRKEVSPLESLKELLYLLVAVIGVLYISAPTVISKTLLPPLTFANPWGFPPERWIKVAKEGRELCTIQ